MALSSPTAVLLQTHTHIHKHTHTHTHTQTYTHTHPHNRPTPSRSSLTEQSSQVFYLGTKVLKEIKDKFWTLSTKTESRIRQVLLMFKRSLNLLLHEYPTYGSWSTIPYFLMWASCSSFSRTHPILDRSRTGGWCWPKRFKKYNGTRY